MTGYESAQPRIVVGVDGSPGSYAALRWAGRQARQVGAAIDAVYVLEPIVPLDFTGAGYIAVAQLDTRALHASGQELLRKVLAEAGIDDSVTVHPVVVEHASPGQALVRAAANASMLVVGAHHHHGLGLLLGSTGANCVRKATCPVVVIPETWSASDDTFPAHADSVIQREEVLT